MATFKNLDDLMKYIEKATAESMKEVGEKLEDIMKDTIDEEVYDAYDPKIYDRSYQLRDKMVEVKSDNNSAEVRIAHTGDHISYIKGTRFYVPYGLEGGYTWGRGATNIQENSLKKAEDEIPDTYKKAMRSKGIPVK